MILRATFSSRQSGFTLLEVMLASVITVLLMAGLYVAINMMYGHADAGRRAVEQGTHAQAVIQELMDDIRVQLSPVLPKVWTAMNPSSSDTSGTTAGSGSSPSVSGSSGSGTSGSGTSGSGASASGASGSGTSGAGAAAAGTPAVFNQMVQGDANHLTIYVSRVPREVLVREQASTQATVSDLRRVSYWLEDSKGLVRQEIKQATSAEALNTTPSYSLDDAGTVVSDRVKSLTFSYYDPNAQSWTDSWDGTQTGPDGTTSPKGPPSAIKIEMEIAPPPGDGDDNQKNWKTYRQIIPILTANGQQATQ